MFPCQAERQVLALQYQPQQGFFRPQIVPSVLLFLRETNGLAVQYPIQIDGLYMVLPSKYGSCAFWILTSATERRDVPPKFVADKQGR